MFDEIILVE